MAHCNPVIPGVSGSDSVTCTSPLYKSSLSRPNALEKKAGEEGLPASLTRVVQRRPTLYRLGMIAQQLPIELGIRRRLLYEGKTLIAARRQFSPNAVSRSEERKVLTVPSQTAGHRAGGLAALFSRSESYREFPYGEPDCRRSTGHRFKNRVGQIVLEGRNREDICCAIDIGE